MRILVISDTHGDHGDFLKVLKCCGHVDMVIHAGDVCGEEAFFENAVQCPLIMVKGNNDYNFSLDKNRLLDIEGHTVFVTHGHLENVYFGPWTLTEKAKRQGADVAIYGHTHIPAIQYDEDLEVWAVNPGSLTYPRQNGRQSTYMIMELTQGEKPRFKIEFVD